MSTSITTAFINQYEAEVNHVFQRQGGYLRDAVRTKDGVVGSTCIFQKIGKGTATTKARHGVITPMNQTHTAPSATLSDFYAGDWVDKLDEAKTNIDERNAIARGGAWALGRKVDDQILTVLDGTSQSTATVTVTSFAAVKGTIGDWITSLWQNDVPNDGMVYGVISPNLWQIMAASISEFSSSDYVNIKPYTEGVPVRRAREWNGVKWMTHTGLSGHATNTCKGFLFHRDSIGYATGAHDPNSATDAGNTIKADITWHGDRAAHFVNHMMSGGGVLIDDTGVIEANWDDTDGVPTS